MVVTVARAEMEQIWMVGGIADHQIARADIGKADVEQKQTTCASHSAAFHDCTIAGSESPCLHRHVGLQQGLIDDQVWSSICGDPCDE